MRFTPRELNGIVREGIRNPTVWQFVGHDIYSEDPNAPWEANFEAVSKLLLIIVRPKRRNMVSPTPMGRYLGFTVSVDFENNISISVLR